ncbi:MAG: transposase [Nitrososphaerales archaeon]|nr:transposase [Nitrososphaerales archaeon]
MPPPSDIEVGKPRITRRSPVRPTSKLCPKCLKPLQKGSKLGGWLVPQDYYCTSCGYKGTVYLEKASHNEGES